jgi:hypothetical protein
MIVLSVPEDEDSYAVVPCDRTESVKFCMHMVTVTSRRGKKECSFWSTKKIGRDL